MPISALHVRDSPEFSRQRRHAGNWDRGTRYWRQISYRK